VALRNSTAKKGLFPDKDAPSLAGLLPYHASDPAGDLFLLRDGSLGMAWRLAAPETEVLSTDALGRFAARLDALLRLLPIGSAAQFLWSSRRDVRTRTRAWVEATTVDGLSADLAASRASATESFSFLHEGVLCSARLVETIFTLRTWPKWPRTGWRERYAEEKRRLLERAEAVENLFQQSDVGHRRLDGAALLARVHAELNPGPRPAPSERPDRPMAERLAFTSFELEEGVLKLGPSRRRILSAADLPRETWAGMLQRGRPAPLDVAGEGTFVLNIECRDPESVRRFLAAKKRLAFCQMGGGGDGRADLSAIKGEVDGVLSEMYVEGARAFTARLHLVVGEEAASPVVNAMGSI